MPSLIGTALGYILLSPADSFRYLAAVIAIGGVRWLFSDWKRLVQNRLFAPLAAFIPILATGIALLFGSGSRMSEFAACVIEATLAAAAAYFFSVTVRLAGEKRSLTRYTPQETACLVMTGCVLLLSLGSLAIENVSVGRILAVVAVLLCARYGGVQGGTVSGVSSGAVFSLANTQQGFLCGSYAFGGLMAGLFSGVGKLGNAIAFLVASSLMSLAFGGSLFAPALIETVIGGGIFMLLPKDLGSFIAPLFERAPSPTLGEAVRKGVVMRLDAASRAIQNVRGDVEEVSRKLGSLYSPGFDAVCEGRRRGLRRMRTENVLL